MVKQQILVVALVAVSLCAIAVGVYMANNNDEPSGDITVTDARGRAVALDGTPEKILAINCCSLELLSYFESVNKAIAIDTDDVIVGDKTYTQAHKEFFSGLEKVNRRNVEGIIALNPDLIITSTVDVGELDKLQSDTGIPVFAINADVEFGNEMWYTQIETLGKVLGEEKRAEDIVKGVKGIIDEVCASSVTGINGYACGMLFHGSSENQFLRTSGDWLPFDYAGIENVMPRSKTGVGGQPYNVSDVEEVMKRDIDCIFIDNASRDGVVDKIKEHIVSDGLSNDAITNGEIYNVCLYKKWGTQFDAVLINCLYVAKTMNPDGYSWDFEDKADEVLELLYGDKVNYETMKSNGNGCGKITL